MKKILVQSLIALISITLFGQPAMAEENTSVESAVARLSPLKDSGVEGTLTLKKTTGGIQISGEITGLTPGEHGFHIHQYGDCTAADGSSAGGHFAAGGHMHGAPEADGRHAGDLGNLTADENGAVSVNITDDVISFDGENSVLGRAFIVHEKKDDLKSQPTGDAGGRVACGVIGIAK